MKRKLVLLMALIIVFVGTLSVAFRVQRVEAGGTIYIRANGLIEGTDKITSADNTTYTFTMNINDSIVIERSNIVLHGVGYTLQGAGSGAGISLSGIINVTIRNMEITAFEEAIILDLGSSNNMILENTFTTNNWGVKFNQGSNNNTLSGNTITNNDVGLELDSSSDNKFFHNDFIDNSEQVIIYNSTCFWDDGYPSGGNLWSDYTDVDDYSGINQDEAGGDGIWDHSYNIDANNIDNYPIVPEFLTWTSMLLILMVFTVAITIYKRRLLKTPIH